MLHRFSDSTIERFTILIKVESTQYFSVLLSRYARAYVLILTVYPGNKRELTGVKSIRRYSQVRLLTMFILYENICCRTDMLEKFFK